MPDTTTKNTNGNVSPLENANSYTLKTIAVTITLDGQEAKRLEGFAVKVDIQKSGSPAYPKASVTIKGLKLDTMAQLTHLAFGSKKLKKNKIKIEAGTLGESLATVFTGDILSAWADFNSVPSPEFKIEAEYGSFPALIPHDPISVRGNQPVAEIFNSICNEIGATFENNDVTASVKNCILEGDPITKLKKLAEQIGANVLFDDDKVVLLPRDSTRKATGEIPLIKASNGLIGYPTFTNDGISFSTFFRPDLRIGAQVRVESEVPRATGTWKITSLKHSLSAYDKEGSAWKTDVDAAYQKT